jgi:hypothetical protein
LQSVGDVDVQDQLGKGRAVFELNRHIREWGVIGATDENGLTAADAEVAAAGKLK